MSDRFGRINVISPKPAILNKDPQPTPSSVESLARPTESDLSMALIANRPRSTPARRTASVRDRSSSTIVGRNIRMKWHGQDQIVLFKRFRQYAAQFQWQQNLAMTLLVLWGLFIVYGTMLPFDFSASGELIQLRGCDGCGSVLYGVWAGRGPMCIAMSLFFMPWGFLLADLAGRSRVEPGG